MSKIAIVTDSNSGITQREAEQMGVFVVPMPFMINEQEYFEDVNLTQTQFYEMLSQNAEVATSQPSIEGITKVWDQVLESYDSLLYIPMSSGLSGTCSTAAMLSEDYNGRVRVVDNQRISVTQRNSVVDALAMAQAGKNLEEIYAGLMDTKLEASIYNMVDTLKYLKKGGRLTPAVAALGTLLRIKPVLQIQGERLDTFAKARTAKQGTSIMLNAIQEDMETRFHNEVEKMHINVAHTQNEEGAEAVKEQLLQLYPGQDILINPLSLSVSCHIGPGALAIAIAKKAG